MNKQEFAVFAAALKTYYPREDRLLPNQPAMELWYRELRDLPFPLAEAVLRKWVAMNKWSPGISDLRELAAAAAYGQPDTWGEAWEQVTAAIRRFGSYNESQALASLDDLTRRAVECMGYRQLCLSETVMQDRAQFRQVYENLAAREKTDRQLSPQLRGLLQTARGMESALPAHEATAGRAEPLPGRPQAANQDLPF